MTKNFLMTTGVDPEYVPKGFASVDIGDIKLVIEDDDLYYSSYFMYGGKCVGSEGNVDDPDDYIKLCKAVGEIELKDLLGIS